MSSEHSFDGETCLVCTHRKMFSGEGCYLHGEWLCSHNCLVRASERFEWKIEEKVSM